MPHCTTKNCSRCKQDKPLNEFSRSTKKRGGRQSYCKACQLAYYAANKERITERVRVWREANRERFSETQRAWAKANPERVAEKGRAWRAANPERSAELNRAWREANPKKAAENTARYRAKYPDRHATRQAVSNAMRDGRMPPARDFTCTCGAPAEQYHHHNGYSPEHKFDVIPVCRACHAKLHRMRSE